MIPLHAPNIWQDEKLSLDLEVVDKLSKIEMEMVWLIDMDTRTKSYRATVAEAEYDAQIASENIALLCNEISESDTNPTRNDIDQLEKYMATLRDVCRVMYGSGMSIGEEAIYLVDDIRSSIPEFDGEPIDDDSYAELLELIEPIEEIVDMWNDSVERFIKRVEHNEWAAEGFIDTVRSYRTILES